MQNVLLLSEDTRDYTSRSLKKKFVEKEKLQEKYGLIKNKKTFCVGMVGGFHERGAADMLLEILEALFTLSIEMVGVSVAEEKYQGTLEALAKQHSEKFCLIEENPENIRDIFAMSDVVLIPEFDERTVESCLSYACIPLVFESGLSGQKILRDFNPLLEKGNAFSIKGDSRWHILETILRAKETFRFPYDWEVLKSHAIRGE